MPDDKKNDCLKSRPYRLENAIQHYDWGTRNDQAFIAHLLGIEVEQDKPYAELWMGIHPNAPSLVIDPDEGSQKLSEWLAINPIDRLGIQETNPDSKGLPYLFKVLSADQALSIQAHPNKPQAEDLHRQDPEHYPDNNHKPEIAIAIDHLDALVGFINNEQYHSLLEITPEFNTLFKDERGGSLDLQRGVQQLLKIWEDDQTSIIVAIDSIYLRFQQIALPDETQALFLDQVQRRGTADIGLLFIFLLNRIHLGPGEAVFLAPGVPHAYIKGNIIECMANSDNVVRLGLTGKFCDAPTLAEILVFDDQSDYRIEQTSDGYLSEYHSPTCEFTVKSLNLLQGESRAFSFRSTLTLFLLLEGEISLHWGEERNSCTSVYRRGNSFIAPANLREFTLQARNHSKLFLVDLPAES